MSGKQNINMIGTIQNLLDEGFDTIAAIKEIMDNSKGAGAKNIYIILDIKNLILIIFDNGTGMNKRGLNKLATLNDRKSISEIKQGKYGQGVKLALAYLTQLKGNVTIISKTNDFDATEENDISELVIKFKEAATTGEYNDKSENACTANIRLWEKYSKLCGKDSSSTGTLISIKMDKRKCKELYKQITTKDISNSILFNVALVNYDYLRVPSNKITFVVQQIILDKEPEIVVETEGDLDINEEEEDNTNNSFDIIPANNIASDISSETIFSEDKWDVECSEDYHNYDVPSFCPIINENNPDVNKYECTVLENMGGDIITVLNCNDKSGFVIINDENVSNLSKKPKKIEGNENDLIKSLKYEITDRFTIYLANNENWINANSEALCSILRCNTSELPKESNSNKRDLEYNKMLQTIKGDYYVRGDTIAINARKKARNTRGGTMSKVKYEENMIALIKYPPSLDKIFGVTVKKYNTIEEIVHPSVRNIKNYLIKRMATDYHNKIEHDKKIAEKQRKAELEAEKQRKAELEAENKRKAELEAENKRKVELEAENKRKAELEAENKRKVELEIVESEEEVSSLEEEVSSSEEDVSSSEEDVSSSEEDVSSSEEKLHKDIKTGKSVRKSNEATYLSKKVFCECLEHWQKTNIHIPELIDIVNFMWKSYELCKPSIIKSVLSDLTLDIKIKYLLIEIKSRYICDDDRISCGAEFANIYQKYFNK